MTHGMTQALRNLILAGVFAAPFLVFIVPDSMFFPFITGKNFAFRVLVELMLGAWVLLALYSPAYRPRVSPILIAISAFVGVMFIANLLGENIAKSMWSNYERMDGWVTLAHLLAYFLVLTSVLTTQKLWTRFFQVSLGVSVLMGIYGLFQLGGALEIHQGSSRLDGTFGNATYLAVYALFHIFLAALLAVQTYARSKHSGQASGFALAMYAAIAVLNMFMLYQTATRGAILGFIGGMLLVSLLVALFGGREYPKARKWSAGAILGLLVLIGGFIAMKDAQFIQESGVLSRFANISLEDNTTKARFIIWGMSLEGLKEHPILGWGQGNFMLLFNEYYEPALYAQEPFFDRAHNVFFDWLIAGGILGLLAYLAIFGAILYMLWRRSECSFLEKSVLTGLLAAYFFHNIFVFDNLISYMYFALVAAYVHVRSVSADAKPLGGERYVQTPPHVLGAVALIATLVLVVAANAKPYFANRAIIEGMQLAGQGQLAESQKEFERAIGYGTFGTPEAREHFMQTAQRIAGRSEIPQGERLNYINAAFRELEKQIEAEPNNARYRLLLGSFAGGLGRHERAIAEFEKAIELSPGKQAIYHALAQVYLARGEYDKALEIAREAYELDMSNPDARDIYALMAIYAGERALAEELLLPVYGTIAVPDDRFVQAFATRGEYDRVIEIWQKRIADLAEKGQADIQYHVSLAATYLRVGRNADAIAELERAIELEPKFEAQGRQFIELIRAGRGSELLQ